MTLENDKRLILVINTGGGSTKVAVYAIDPEFKITQIFNENIRHSVEDLRRFENIMAQKDWRKEQIQNLIESHNVETEKIIAVVSRGGLLRPLPGGTYQITDEMIADFKAGKVQAEHASNVCPVIADEFAKEIDCPAYFVDPPCTDELMECARFTGNPLFKRSSLTHALNIKHIARKTAQELGKPYEDCRFVVTHLGSGISITSHANGKMIDINDSTAEGPFGTQRAGGLPIRQVLMYLMDNPEKVAELDKNLISNSGLVAYRGTDDFVALLKDVKSGDENAMLIYDAFVHQLVKEVGAFAAVLDGKVDAVVFTGGMAYSTELQEVLTARCSWIAPVKFFPGEDEMLALATGFVRVLSGEESVKTYS